MHVVLSSDQPGPQTSLRPGLPTDTRKFGDINDRYDPVRYIIDNERVSVLQPHLLTRPKCYYIGLDKEVR